MSDCKHDKLVFGSFLDRSYEEFISVDCSDCHKEIEYSDLDDYMIVRKPKEEDVRRMFELICPGIAGVEPNKTINQVDYIRAVKLFEPKEDEEYNVDKMFGIDSTSLDFLDIRKKGDEDE